MSPLHAEDPFSIIARHQKAPPVLLGPIAKDLKLRVHRMAMESVAGMIKRDNDGAGYVIFLNATDSVTRQRFTLAHEIAHYILHRDLIEDGVIDDTMYHSALSDRYETQANQLASDILMPVRLIKKYRAEHPGSDWKELAKAFEVSPEAMKIRLTNMRFAGEMPTRPHYADR